MELYYDEESNAAILEEKKRGEEKVKEFLEENNDLLRTTFVKDRNDNLRVGLSLEFVHNTEYDRISMIIDILDYTTLDDIRNNWGLIIQWRERLQKYQRVIPPTESDEFHEFLYWLKKFKDYSYQEIAVFVNTFVSNLLSEHFRLMQDDSYRHTYTHHGVAWSKNGPVYDNYREVPCYCPKLLESRQMIRWIGIDEEETELLIQVASENFEFGSDLFPPDTPTTREMIIARIRKVKEKVKKGYIINRDDFELVFYEMTTMW